MTLSAALLSSSFGFAACFMAPCTACFAACVLMPHYLKARLLALIRVRVRVRVRLTV